MSLAAPPTSVLTIEDDPIIRADLRLVVGTAGFDVCADARDGVEAIELAREQGPDVILLDLGLPRLGGVEATRRILITQSYGSSPSRACQAACRRSDQRRRYVRRPQAVRRRGRGARVAGRRHRAAGGEPRAPRSPTCSAC